MAVIKSGSSSNQLDIDSTSKAARVTLYDSLGNELSLPSTNKYGVSGATTAVTAASLATNTSLMSLRFNIGVPLKMYITSFKLLITPSTLGTSALVPGVIGIQRFMTATPTGGLARTPYKKDTSFIADNVLDVRDSNAALTVTSVVFGDVVGLTQVPIFTQGAPFLINFFNDNSPLILNAGDGIVLRTQSVMPATQTWKYSYNIEWYER